MNQQIKDVFKKKLGIFFKKAIHEINCTRKKYKKTFMEKINTFEISEHGYGDKMKDVINPLVIHSLYEYNNHFRFKEALEIAEFITKHNIFHVISNTKESNLSNYLLNTLEDYIKSRKKFSFSHKSSEKFINDLIKGLENENIVCEIAFFLPNLDLPISQKNKIDLGNGFFLKKANKGIKESIINSFIESTTRITDYNVYYKSIVESQSIIYKKFLIKKGANEINNYGRGIGMYPNGGILKEINLGIECIKKINIYLGGHIYISNAFFRDADIESYLELDEWKTDRNIDFFVPNMTHGNHYVFKKGIQHFKRFYNKINKFEFKNIQTPIGRYLNAIEQGNNQIRIVKDLNPVIDYIIMLESLLLDYDTEISFQFALMGSAFFGKNKSERTKLFGFFKKVYQLRSDILHGNDGIKITKTINKLKGIEPNRLNKLKQYSHDIILYLINKKIENKKDLINLIKKKLYLPTIS